MGKKYLTRADFRCLSDSFNCSGRCKEQCDTCRRVAGVLHTNAPPINTDVLVLLNLGQIRVGQWTGTSWHIHAAHFFGRFVRPRYLRPSFHLVFWGLFSPAPERSAGLFLSRHRRANPASIKKAPAAHQRQQKRPTRSIV